MLLKEEDYKNNGGLFIPLGNHNAEFKSLRIKKLLENLIKGSEIEENYLKKTKVDILGLI